MKLFKLYSIVVVALVLGILTALIVPPLVSASDWSLVAIGVVWCITVPVLIGLLSNKFRNILKGPK